MHTVPKYPKIRLEAAVSDPEFDVHEFIARAKQALLDAAAPQAEVDDFMEEVATEGEENLHTVVEYWFDIVYS